MISRFDKLQQRDWDWKTSIPLLPELDFNALDGLMKETQDGLNISDNFQKPKVLNTEVDPELAKQYNTLVEDGKQKVSDTFLNQGIRAGKAAQIEYLNNIKKQWQPGGIAHTLNTRYDSYTQATKDIEDFQKKDKRGINSQLAKMNLQKSINNPIDYNSETGEFNNVKTPDLQNDPELRGVIDDMLKEIKATGTTSFLGDFNKDLWIQKIQKEVRSEKQIELAFQALSEQPEFQSQLARDAQYKSFGVNPEEYKANFEKNQQKGLSSLETFAKSASGDSAKTKQWQNLLRSEGYNIEADGDFGTLTENATKEFLQNKKERVNESISNFKIEDALADEVKNSYLNYAKRGAYSKTDIDPFFNQAIKAKADIAQKNRELNLMEKRIELEFAPKESSGITVVSGVAAQLPELDKMRDQAKTNKIETESQLNNALSRSDTFKGWKIENVGAAYSKWTQVRGNTEEEKKQNYKNLLNENGTHQFSDAEVDNLYKEMNAPRDQSSLQNVLVAYNEASQTSKRFEDTKLSIAEQYLDTNEGKAALSDLRNSAPQSFQVLSDKELVQKALTEPDLFKIKIPTTIRGGGISDRNGAIKFNRSMASDIATLEKNGSSFNWGDSQTYEVYADNSDKSLRPLLDGVAQAIVTGSGKNFQSFGAMGLSFKDKKGEPLQGSSKKVDNMSVARNSKGQPILKVGVKVTDSAGSVKDGYTEVNISPGSPEARQLVTSLKSSYVTMLNSGNAKSAYGILDNIQALQGEDELKFAAIDSQKDKLNLNNTYNQGVKHKTENNQIIDIGQFYGDKTIDLHNDETVAGLRYKTLGVTTKSGPKLLNVVIGDDGGLYATPHDNGGIYYNSASEISRDRLGKMIQSQTPVEVKETKK